LSTTLTLYIRHGCHLCEAFREELEACKGMWQFVIEDVDVDSNRLLAEKYGTRVPVLVIDGEELCQYFFDPLRLKTYFEQS